MKEIMLNNDLVALVDDDDYPYLMRWKWIARLSNNKRPRAIMSYTFNGKNYSTQMSRLVMGVCDPNIFVDHVDQNTLNNQRSNLRLCTRQENGRNVSVISRHKSSKYKGVYYRTSRDSFVADIYIGSGVVRLGSYKDEEVAAAVYNFAAAHLFGDFACLNDVGNVKLDDNTIKIVTEKINKSKAA